MPEINLSLDGTPLTARAGQTVGAAMTEAGITSWRTTRKNGRPRGLFCGIGVCFDCLVTVDGVANQRACITPVRDGMALETGSVVAAPAIHAAVDSSVVPPSDDGAAQ